jgi:hypothetical protein
MLNDEPKTGPSSPASRLMLTSFVDRIRTPFFK